MQSTFEISWKREALLDYMDTLENVEARWSLIVAQNLAMEVERTLILIAQNPYLFQVVFEKEKIHRAVVLRLNSIYYQIQGDTIEIISFFQNRQDPDDRKL